jgi:hypothetical protein
LGETRKTGLYQIYQLVISCFAGSGCGFRELFWFREESLLPCLIDVTAPLMSRSAGPDHGNRGASVAPWTVGCELMGMG